MQDVLFAIKSWPFGGPSAPQAASISTANAICTDNAQYSADGGESDSDGKSRSRMNGGAKFGGLCMRPFPASTQHGTLIGRKSMCLLVYLSRAKVRQQAEIEDKGNSIVSDKAADESVMSYQFLQRIAPSWGWTRGFWRSTSGWTLVVSKLVQ